jgi:predicted metal-dependent hydrolase
MHDEDALGWGLMADDSDQLEQGRAAFNRGEYFLAHELWEEVWRKVEKGEQRTCVQGLIQIAAGLHHLQQRRTGPGVGLLRKGLDKLGPRRDRSDLLGQLDVDLLAGQLGRLLIALEAPRMETAMEATNEVTMSAELSHLKL